MSKNCTIISISNAFKRKCQIQKEGSRRCLIQVCCSIWIAFLRDLMRRRGQSNKRWCEEVKKGPISFLLQGLVAKKCPGADVQSFPCNTDPCHMRWSSWGNCSETCARGTQRAYTECIIGNTKPKEGEDLSAYEWKDCSSIGNARLCIKCFQFYTLDGVFPL